MLMAPECGVDAEGAQAPDGEMTPAFAILIPAAGASSRMRGGDKLLEPIEGVACLRGIAERALQISSRVIVTLPAAPHARYAVLEDLNVVIVPVENAALGMGHSLMCGVQAVPNGWGVMIVPGDMPDLEAEDLAQVAAAFNGKRIVRGMTQSGAPGHPILFPARLLAGFATLSGDRGASEIVRREMPDVTGVRLRGDRAILDLDTPEEWAAYRARQ